jgi:hypothetical protein
MPEEWMDAITRAANESRAADNGKHEPGAGDSPAVKAEDVATIHDLIRVGAEITWLWEWWIPTGVLTAVAAKGGTGKTRFCADLLRRIRHGLKWPDGTEMKLPPETIALWVVADNHHDEMVTLCRDFDIVDGVRLNASKADPYGGVTLESVEDYAMLEARIAAVKPTLVIVDTVGNATDKNLSRQEDAKMFYQPLQLIARKHRCAILCLTHLNAAGQFLGRRVQEKVRVAIRIDQYEGDDKRRLEVKKTNRKTPPALGMIMEDNKNEYDDQPPEPPPEEGGKPSLSPKVQQAVDWLRRVFTDSTPKRVSNTIDSAKMAGITKGTLYRAKDILLLNEFETEGYKFWELVNRGHEE